MLPHDQRTSPGSQLLLTLLSPRLACPVLMISDCDCAAQGTTDRHPLDAEICRCDVSMGRVLVTAVFACLVAANIATNPLSFQETVIRIAPSASERVKTVVGAYFVPEFNRITAANAFRLRYADSEAISAQPVTVIVYIDTQLAFHVDRCSTLPEEACVAPCVSTDNLASDESAVLSVRLPTADIIKSLSLIDTSLITANSTQHIVVVSATSENGVRAGLAMLLQALLPTLHQSPRALTHNTCQVHSPLPWMYVRGHQFGLWGFSFQPWPAAAKQYVFDLVTFGTNQARVFLM